jgi:hypothetical protein
MAPLGLGLAATNGSSMSGSTVAAAIDDYMWSLITSGNVQPLAAGTVSDFHDTWDLDGNDYMPQQTTTVSDEGYWDLDSNSDVQPLDV